jgi:GT2 family glycosyltransferase
MSSEADPEISVIIPCYNSARTIRPCLAALHRQQTSARFDITVVDSSEDRTADIVREEFPSVRVIKLERRTFAGAARNVGVRETTAPLCLMIDSDCIAAPDLIERMMTRHRDGRYAAVGGSLRNGTPWSASGWVCYLMEFKEYTPRSPARLDKSVPTANVAYRRDVLERFGFFDDDMWLAEDILFNWKIFKAGERIFFDPEIVVTHLNRTGWLDVLPYQAAMGKLSAVARRRGGLPGQILLKYPILVTLMPFARLLRAFVWLAKNDKSAFGVLIILWPMYLLATTFWSYGFLAEVLSSRDSSTE